MRSQGDLLTPHLLRAWPLPSIQGSKYERGQILVIGATAERLHGQFDLREQPPMALKGKSVPLRIYAVIGESGRRRLGLP